MPSYGEEGVVPARRRVALYSHDTQGLGHVRRNIGLAAAIVEADPATDVLLITGAPEATGLPLPPSTDVLTLPTLRKDGAGRYAARVLETSLADVLALRSSIIAAALASFGPDLFVVDKVARGIGNELDAALTHLRGTDCFVALGLREILDDAEVACREWEAGATTETVRDLYDAVWVYGDRAVCDPVEEYGLPSEVATKVRHTGYLANGRGAGTVTRVRSVPRVPPPEEPYVLCLVGGGQDGFDLADAFARSPLPEGRTGVLLTGPYMRREQREALRDTAAQHEGTMRVVEFVPDTEDFIAAADSVVSMAGYNSTCELLASGCRTLLVPREVPRTEQLLRAERLSALGWVDLLRSPALSPQALGRWLAAVGDRVPPTDRVPLALDGLAVVGVLAGTSRRPGAGASVGARPGALSRARGLSRLGADLRPAVRPAVRVLTTEEARRAAG